ncbi:MAG: hypothetical protein ABIG44_18385 [Planctomycetota bacterium]
MKPRKLRWTTAGLCAFLLGVPLAERAEAANVGGLVEAAIALTLSIISVAGDS